MTGDFYIVNRASDHVILGMPWTLKQHGRYPIVDAYRTLSAAEYACRLLNQGNARINPHAVIGCRIEAR